MGSIADVFITVMPETSRVADGIKRAFKEVDKDAREAGGRWKKEIEGQLKDVKVKVSADTAKAKAEIDSLDGKNVTVKVDVDRSSLDRVLGGGGGGGGGLPGGGGAFNFNAGLVGIGLLPAAATAIANVAGAVQQLAGAGLVLPGVFAGIASSVGTASLGMHGMKDALDAVSKASDGTKASVEAADKALAGLSANQAEVVKTVSGLKGTFTDLQHIAGQNMFAGVSDGLKGLVGNLLPAATRGIDGISRSLNQNLLQAMNSLGSGSSQGMLSRIFGNTASAQGNLTAAIDPIIHAVGTLAAAGSDSLPRLATAVGNVAERFNKFITAADGDGRLQKWISQGIDGFTNLGNIALNLGKSFTAITQAAGGGAGLLGTLQSATEKMQLFLNSTAGQEKLSNFFAEGRDMLGQLRDVAVQLGPILGGVFQAGLNSANMWLPVIREVLSDINAIPGGAAAVVGAFAAWKTISGVSNLLNSLNTVATMLKVTLPAAAVEGGAAAAAGMGPLIAAIGAAVFAGKGLADMLVNTNRDHYFNADGSLKGSGDQWIVDHLGPVGRFLEPSGARSTPAAPPAASTHYGPRDNDASPVSTVYGPRTSGGDSPLAPAQSPQQITDEVNRRIAASRPALVPQVPVSSYVAPVVTQGSGGGGANSPYEGGYTSDRSLLANVPAGSYSQTSSADLTKGLGDCSSAVEDLVNLMQGNSTAGRSMSTGNAPEWLAAHGFVPGSAPGAFNVGFNNEHMQATLPGGTPFNWGSNAAAANRGIGGTGAFDPAFTQHYYLPVANGSGSQSSMFPYGTKEKPMYVASADKQANSGAQNLGGDFMSGIAQIFGFDGTLFQDPSQFGLTKILGAITKLKPADSSGMPSGGGGGLGGLLGLAQNFMPGMPGGNSANLLDAVQFSQTGAPGSPGPGNNPAPGYQNSGIDMRGAQLGVNPGDLTNQLSTVTASQNRWAPLQQNLPH